jgi:hypothetical protein
LIGKPTDGLGLPERNRINMKSERELVREISRIGRVSKSAGEAVALVQALLTTEIGAFTLLLDFTPNGISPRTAEFVSIFLDSRQFPFRGLYTEPLFVANGQAGRLFGCVGSFGTPGELPQHLIAHIAHQLGELFAQAHGDAVAGSVAA